MTGGETPETCWATHKRQVINLWNCCILLVDLFESYDDARTCERQTSAFCYPLAVFRKVSGYQLVVFRLILNLKFQIYVFDSVSFNYFWNIKLPSEAPAIPICLSLLLSILLPFFTRLVSKLGSGFSSALLSGPTRVYELSSTYFQNRNRDATAT